MTASDLVKALASSLEDGEKLNFQWEIHKRLSFGSMTNTHVVVLDWYRNNQGDMDFEENKMKIEDFYYTDEVDMKKIIREYMGRWQH